MRFLRVALWLSRPIPGLLGKQQREANAFLGTVAVSADGSRIYTVSGDPAAIEQSTVYLSINHGTNWTHMPSPINRLPDNLCIACSADGIKLIEALGNGGISYSTNGGTNLYTSSVSPAGWISLASSADGAHMVAAASGGSIYLSGDFGVTWTPTNLPTEAWKSVCTSADGKWIGATSDAHSYISADSGVTWLTNDF